VYGFKKVAVSSSPRWSSGEAGTQEAVIAAEWVVKEIYGVFIKKSSKRHNYCGPAFGEASYRLWTADIMCVFLYDLPQNLQ